MSTSSYHTKAFVQCFPGKHTVASSRTLLSDHVCFVFGLMIAHWAETCRLILILITNIICVIDGINYLILKLLALWLKHSIVEKFRISIMANQSYLSQCHVVSSQYGVVTACRSYRRHRVSQFLETCLRVFTARNVDNRDNLETYKVVQI